MAQSRLDKIGTIYSRTVNLIKAGGMKEENKPLWLDLYKAFPPKYEPRFDRPPVCQEDIRPIFYHEDRVRAKFHKEFPQYGMVNLLKENHISKTEQFLQIYKQMDKEGCPENELFDRSIEQFFIKVKDEVLERRARAEAKESSENQNLETSSRYEEKQASGEEESGKKYKAVVLNLEKLLQYEKEKPKSE